MRASGSIPSVLLGAIILGSCAAATRKPVLSPKTSAPAMPLDSTRLPRDESAEQSEPETSGDPSSFDDNSPSQGARQSSGDYSCTSPRPRVCEATPSPVCARRQALKTSDSPPEENNVNYVNGCIACADPSVVGYVEGRCAASKSSSAPTTSSKRQ